MVAMAESTESAAELGEAVDSLRGSRCGACGIVAFPVATGCQRCGAQQMVVTDLSRHGVIWGWTVQRFAPKSPPYVPPPGGFTPFAVGYVELPEGVKVQALLECADVEELDAGMSVQLVGTEPVPRFATIDVTSASVDVETVDVETVAEAADAAGQKGTS